MHSTADANPLKFTLKGFAVGNGCTDPLECEFQNDYGLYLMEFYRDIGFISEAQYVDVDSKCNNQSSELSKACEDAINEVPLNTFRSIAWLTDSTSTMLTNLAMRTTTRPTESDTP